uniref:Uncharacterized protein n=1 Tax=Arundo donax TaxID=35708 RepID=A0A0A9AJ54_ARUDO
MSSLKLEMLPSEDRMPPVRLFLDRSRVSSSDNNATSTGMCPTSWFLDRSTALRLVQLVSSLGILPCSELFAKIRNLSCRRRPKLGCISPVKPFCDKLSVVRNVKFPRDGEMWPCKPWLARSRAVKRRVCFTL